MPNPYRKHTRMRTSKRRAQNSKLDKTGESRCGNCGKASVPHCVCGNCGFYKGQLAIVKKVKKTKKGKSEPEEGGQE